MQEYVEHWGILYYVQSSLELLMRDAAIVAEERENVWKKLPARVEKLVENRVETTLSLDADLGKKEGGGKGERERESSGGGMN